MRVLTSQYLAVLSSAALSKGVPYLMLPIISGVLTPTDMGKLSYLASAVTVLSVFIALQPNQYLNVNFPALDSAELEMTMLVILVFACSMSLLALPFSYFFIAKSLLPNFFTFYLSVVPLFFAFTITFSNLFYIILQHRQRYWFLFSCQIVFVLIHYFLGVFLLFFYDASWMSMVLGQFVACTVIVYIIFKSQNIPKLNGSGPVAKSLFNRFFGFSVRAFPYGFALVTLTSADKIIVANLLGFELAGIYGVCFTLGLAIGVYHDSVSRIWTPKLYQIYSDPEPDFTDLPKYLALYALHALAICVLFIVAATPLLGLLFAQEYRAGMPVVYLTAVTYTIEPLRKFFASFYLIEGELSRLSLHTVCVSVLGLGLQIYFISQFGFVGAAFALLSTYVILTTLMGVSCSRFSSMRRAFL